MPNVYILFYTLHLVQDSKEYWILSVYMELVKSKLFLERVRMAERSKAPDSRFDSFLSNRGFLVSRWRRGFKSHSWHKFSTCMFHPHGVVTMKTCMCFSSIANWSVTPFTKYLLICTLIKWGKKQSMLDSPYSKKAIDGMTACKHVVVPRYNNSS